MISLDSLHLKERLSANRTVDAQGVINGLLCRVTSLIYNYIHKHSANNSAQDELIKHNAFARSIIYRALLSQAIYVVKNGDLSLSVDPQVRSLAIDENAKLELETDIYDIGVSLLYAGGAGYGFA